MTLQAKAASAPSTATSHPPVFRRVLQRNCSCDRTPGRTGKSAEYAKRQSWPQTTPKVDQSGNSYEQEAERTADQIMAIRAHPADRNALTQLPRPTPIRSMQEKVSSSAVEEVLAQPGAPLDLELRHEMEQFLGHDFSNVRVHAGRDAVQSALEVDAEAYTVGRHIVFGAGRFAPHTHDGVRLIAHELTHVVQQAGAFGAREPTSGFLQRQPRSGSLPRQFDIVFEPPNLGKAEGPDAVITPSDAPKAAPVPQPDSVESLDSTPRTQSAQPAKQSLSPPARSTESAPPSPVNEPINATRDAADPTSEIQSGPVAGTPASDESSMPKLADLLLPARNGMAAPQIPLTTDDGAPSGISDSFTAATPDDVIMFVGALRAALGESRKQVAGYAAGARESLGQNTEKATGRVAAEVELADASVQAMIAKRRSNLELTLRATESTMEWQKELRQKEADSRGLDGKLEMAATVSKQRGRVEKAVARWAGYIGTLRDFHIKRVTDAVAENAFQAVHKAELYDARLIRAQSRGPARALVQREATSTLAKALADEFRKAESRTIAEITKSTAEMAGVVYEYGDKFFAEFDKTLPQFLNGIDEQVAAAKEDIAGKAREARAKLTEAAARMRARLDLLEKEGLARNAAIGAAVTRQVALSRTEADQQYQRAVARVMQPIGGVIRDGIEILTAAETLDLDASWQFVGEIVGFSRNASQESGQLFVETRASVANALGRSAPTARREMAGVRKELGQILRDEGVEAELKLVDFETLVDQHYGASIAILDDTFVACRAEARNSLAPAVNEVRQALETGVMEAAVKLREGVNEVLNGQTLGLRQLWKELHKAAVNAAWRYDNPNLKHVVDAINWVGKAIAVLFVAITIIAGLILVFKLALAALSLLVGALVAKAIAALAGAFLIGYFGTKAYVEAKEKKDTSHGRAFLAALGELTGVTQVYRALTDSSLSLEERGVLLGFGALSIFGVALGSARIIKAIKLRFPSRITDPRGVAAMRPIAEAPTTVDLPAVEPPVPVNRPTVVRGFAPKSKSLEVPASADAPVNPPSVVRGFRPRSSVAEPPTPVNPAIKPPVVVRGFAPPSKGLDAPVSVDAPVNPPSVVRGFRPRTSVAEPPTPVNPAVKPPIVVRGFAPPSKGLDAPVSLDGPVTTSPSVGGFGRPSRPRMRVAGGQQTTALDPQLPPALKTPGRVANPGDAQGTRAAAQVAEPAPGTAPAQPGPVKGKAEVLPPAPETVVPKLRPPSRRLGLAEERAAETKELAEKASENVAGAAREKATAERDLEEMKGVDPRKPGDREFIDKELARLRSGAKEAGKKLKAARKSQKDAANEAAEVEGARNKMRAIEDEIAKIDQEIAKVTRDPELVSQHGYKPDQKPPTSTKWGREYERLAMKRRQLVDSFEERFDDVTRRIANQVARMTPGAEGQALALENAKKLGETHKVLKPVGDTPIDVTTGKPIQGEYVSDHLMARTEIARDPRFKLLDRTGRETMLRGIPENSLPITPVANSSKLNRTVSQWIQARARSGNPLDADMAKALREADRVAREAVEAKFTQLLGEVP